MAREKRAGWSRMACGVGGRADIIAMRCSGESRDLLWEAGVGGVVGVESGLKDLAGRWDRGVWAEWLRERGGKDSQCLSPSCSFAITSFEKRAEMVVSPG